MIVYQRVIAIIRCDNYEAKKDNADNVIAIGNSNNGCC